MMRIANSQTRRTVCVHSPGSDGAPLGRYVPAEMPGMLGSATRMNVISATPVTP